MSSINRIQKLLFSEYCDFEDMVLVESPFAETSRDGTGLRQVHLGLTPSKLVLATDVLPLAVHPFAVNYLAGVDPDIETFELVAVYPIECVNLSVFHRKKRQSLKARFCNNKILYFELGGFERRKMFWNLWCEKVKFLNPEDGAASSNSETSVASSTSNSTLYLVSSRRCVNDLSGHSQMWCTFATTTAASGDHYGVCGGGGGGVGGGGVGAKWVDKHLYLGKMLEESPMRYTPCALPPTFDDFVKVKAPEAPANITLRECKPPPSIANNQHTLRINRFSSGIQENCSTGLFLPTTTNTSNDSSSIGIGRGYDTLGVHTLGVNGAALHELEESAVRLWELYGVTASSLSTRAKHRRRYACAPQPHLLHGLGPWQVGSGERYSLQAKRAVSLVRIKRQPLEPELRLAVSRRQLVASISCDCLHQSHAAAGVGGASSSKSPPVLFFWTPEYWYRPRSARDAYQELQMHLNKIRQYHHIKDTFRSKINILVNHRHRAATPSAASTEEDEVEGEDADAEADWEVLDRHKRRRRRVLHKLKPVLSRKLADLSVMASAGGDCVGGGASGRETSVQFLRRVLRLEVAVSAWDFDSSTLAQQLTLIDRELFLRVTPSELARIVAQQSSKNAPNVGALIAFSHRISCLLVTEILKDQHSEKMRARLVARFINTAAKCNTLGNFQSCRSVLCALQSPPIYRLYTLWAYIRKRHASKYRVFEQLCRQYRDPRLFAYQKAFAKVVQSHAPHMPFIGDLIARLLDKIPPPPPQPTLKHTPPTQYTHVKPHPMPVSLLAKLLGALRVWNHVTMATPPPLITSSTQADAPSVSESCVEGMCGGSEGLEVHQQAAAHYAFARNELAMEYLLKARYREDKDNFTHSFSVEPPLHLERHTHYFNNNHTPY